MEVEKKRFQTVAAATLKKKRVSIQLSPDDIALLRKQAARRGVRYETLIANVVHKYASGRLVERKTKDG